MKNKLKGYIAKAEAQKTFSAIEKAGGDLTEIRAIYSKWDKFKDNLVKEKKNSDEKTQKSFRSRISTIYSKK
jgi:Fic family protein